MSTSDSGPSPDKTAAPQPTPQPTPQGAAAQSSAKRPSVWDIFYPRHVAGHQEVIHLASFPEIVFFWPLIICCFLCAAFQGLGLLSPETVGWFASIVLIFNFLVLVQDFDQKQFVILVLVTLALLLGVWIINLYGFAFFTSVARWVASFRPTFSTDAYIVVGTMLLVFFLWGAVSALFDYWRIEQNEFVHYTQPIGRDMSIARLGCTVYKEIPDVFETILTFGGGTLVIKRDNQILASIRNVPFLARRMIAIEHLLSETRVTVTQEAR